MSDVTIIDATGASIFGGRILKTHALGFAAFIITCCDVTPHVFRLVCLGLIIHNAYKASWAKRLCFDASLPISVNATTYVAFNAGGIASATSAISLLGRELKSGTTAEFVAFVSTRFDIVAEIVSCLVSQ
jgi:hypothetical protein